MYNVVYECQNKGDDLLESIEYKCPNCNAELKFNPDTQKLDCEYCLSSFTIEQVKQACAEAENSIDEAAKKQAEQEFSEHTNLYHCGSCGAEIMADDRQTALFCYYCHQPVILSGKMGGAFKPDNADYRALGKKVRSWTSGSYRYTETKEFQICRQANVFTNGIPADGESKIEDLLMESIEPYDYRDLQDFSMSYLSGFYADKYDVDKAAVFPRIRQRATQAAQGLIRSSISGYSSLSPSCEQYNVVNTDWEYMMLPVWFMSYRYKGQIYEFAMNGQTGKLAGTPPLDKGRLALFSSAIGAAAAIICTIIGGVFF